MQSQRANEEGKHRKHKFATGSKLAQIYYQLMINNDTICIYSLP